ncbi:HlyD family secretion protein [Maribacter chungangensis]|uniref:HlyD family secretion protein n=1 Tax=Maribacter chungangensis TaxID=1069117 RepID=A0ABW3B5T1_9FLAO
MPENSIANDLNLRSEEVQEILTNPPVWIVRWGITLVFIFTLIITLLSFIIKYPDFVTAKVVVTTQKPTQTVVTRNAGQLEEVFVKDRDTVTIGQKLAIIENLAEMEDVYLLKSIMDTLLFDKEHFEFPLETTTDLILGDLQNAYIDFEKSYVDYFLLRDLEPYSNRIYGNQQTITEIRLRLIDQIKQKQLLEEEYALAQTDMERHKQLLDKGVISQQEFDNKKRELLQLQKNLSSMAISISQMREATSSANQTLRETKIGQLEDDTRLLKNLVLSYNALKKAVRDWEYKYVLSSNIDGVVSFQEFWGVNQFVNANEVIYTIMPLDKSKLVGKLVLPAQNAGKVTIGQKVLTKLDNYPYQQYGMLVGKVENMSVSPDTEGNYFVYISLPDGTKTSYGQELGFDQELLGNAEIITEDLSVAQRVFYKFKDIFKY